MLLEFILETGIDPSRNNQTVDLRNFFPDSLESQPFRVIRRVKIKEGGYHINDLKACIVDVITNLC